VSHAAPPLLCAECGRPVKRIGGGERYTHAGRGPVAACDLDANHEARPGEPAAATPADPRERQTPNPYE
jgi:hypothetical protein